MSRNPIRVLIADDSALMRREIKNILETDPDIEVIRAARDGREAVEFCCSLKPDVAALDINMPVMDGLTALQHIMAHCPCPVVMISSLTQEGALTTYEALELGAVDFVAKPGGTISKDLRRASDDIIYKVKAAAKAKRRGTRSGVAARPSPQRKSRRATQTACKGKRIVVIGQSTGGPNAIMDIIPLLPENLGAPLIVVQHMPGTFTTSFAERINDRCAFPFKEAARGDIILRNHGYLAPGDIHFTIAEQERGGEKYVAARLSKFPRETLHTPSVDVTMESALAIYGAGVVGVLLTGMGSDGSDAMANIAKAGGRTIAESEETAVVFGMPAEAIRKGGAEFVLPSYEIADKIVELLQS